MKRASGAAKRIQNMVPKRRVERPSPRPLELVHNRDADPEAQSEMQTRRERIERRVRLQDNSRYWLRKVEDMRRARIEAYDRNKPEWKKRYRNERPAGRVGSKIAGTEYARPQKNHEKRAQQRSTHSDTVLKLQRDQEQVRTPATGFAKVGESIDHLRLRMLVGAENPERTATVRDYLAQAQLQRQYRRFYTHTNDKKGTQKDFFRRNSDLLKNGYVSKEQISEAYRQLQELEDQSFEHVSIEWVHPRTFSREQEKAIDAFAAEAENIIEVVHALSAFGVRFEIEAVADLNSEKREDMLRLCAYMAGREQAITEVAEQVAWQTEKTEWTRTAEHVLHIFETTQIVQVIDDPEARAGFIQFMDQFVPAPSAGNLDTFVAAFTDPRYMHKVEYLEQHGYDYLVPEDVLVGLHVIHAQTGVIDIMDRRLEAGFGVFSATQSQLGSVGRDYRNGQPTQEKIADVYSQLTYGVEDILASDDLVALARILGTDLGVRIHGREGYDALRALNGSEYTAAAIAIAGVAFNAEEPLVGDISQILEILDNEESLERILDPEYVHFVRRVQSLPGLHVEVRRSTAIDDGDRVPFLYYWYQRNEYKRMLDDPGVQEFFSTAAEVGANFRVENWLHLEEVLHWATQPAGAQLVRQMGKLGVQHDAMTVFGSGGFRSQVEDIAHGSKAHIFFDDQFPRFFRFMNNMQYSTDRFWGGEWLRAIDDVLRWVKEPEQMETILAMERQDARPMQIILRRIKEEGVYVEPDIDALMQITREDVHRVEAYLEASPGRMYLHELMAFAREPEAIERAKQWWSEHKGNTNASDSFVGYAAFGNALAAGEPPQAIVDWIVESHYMVPQRAALLIENVAGTQQFIQFYEQAVQRYGLDRSLAQLSEGQIEALEQMVPHMDTMEMVASFCEKRDLDIREMRLTRIRAADLETLSVFDAQALDEFTTDIDFSTYRSFADALMTAALAVRLSDRPDVEQDRIWAYIQKHGRRLPAAEVHRSVLERPDAVDVLNMAEELESMGFVIGMDGLGRIASIYDTGRIEQIKQAVTEYGYDPYGRHIYQLDEFIEAGGIEEFFWLQEQYGATLNDAVVADIDTIRRFRLTPQAVAAADRYSALVQDPALMVRSITAETRSWIWAGNHPEAFDAFMSLLPYMSDRCTIRLVQDFTNWYDTDDAALLMQQLQAKTAYSIQPNELWGVLSASRSDGSFIDELAYVNTLSPGFAGEYFARHISRHWDKTVKTPSPLSKAMQDTKRLSRIVMHATLESADQERARAVSLAAMNQLRGEDPVLADQPELQQAAEQQANAFADAVRELYALSETDPAYSDVFMSIHALRYIARQPERVGEVLELPQTAPEFFNLIAPGGALATNRDTVIRDVFGNGNVHRRVRELTSVFTKAVPYWRQLSMFTEMRLGHKLAAAESNQEIPAVGGRSMENIIAVHREAIAADPEAQTRFSVVVPNPEIRDMILEGQRGVRFGDLGGVYKRLVFRERVRETVELSRDVEIKEALDVYNRTNVQEEFRFQTTHFTHGTSSRYLSAILYSGNLCGESLGAGSSTDAVPFHVDLWKLDPASADAQMRVHTIEEMVEKTNLDKYTRSHDAITLMFDRSFEEAVHVGKEVPGGVQGEFHSVLLAGLPSTNVTGIVIHSPDNSLNEVRRGVLEFGAYIPLYDTEGALLYTPEQYDRDYEFLNMGVNVDVWQNSMRIGEQQGSNRGGTYAVATERGTEQHYVKFEALGADRVWNEHLTNLLYAELDIPVAQTQVVKIDGSYGHASLIVPEGGTDRFESELKDGFIADCLFANWDIIFKRNSISTEEGLVRIDNGGSLLFRARGERRTDFDGTVTELESMRRAYPGLTNADIESQVQHMQERFTNEQIDSIVDSVRLPESDRTFLKAVLKERRDYIVSTFLVESAVETEIPAQGELVVDVLRAEQIDDAALAELIPEWSTLMGAEGYQHNRVLLGEHLKDAVKAVHTTPEYAGLTTREQNLASLAMLFHDFGKPTGRRDEQVRRDRRHEIPSASAAARYMKEWGYSAQDIHTVVQVVTYDGAVSDIARGKVNDERMNVSPSELRALVGGNETALRILRAVNKADVIATVGESRFDEIADPYNAYFDELLSAE